MKYVDGNVGFEKKEKRGLEPQTYGHVFNF